MAEHKQTVAVVGLGRIGHVIGQRLLDTNSHRVRGCDISAEAQEHARMIGVDVVATAGEAVEGADVIILALPPAAVAPVLSEIKDGLQDDQVIVSMAGAVPLSFIQEQAGAGTQAARIMPNTPSLIGQGMNPVCFGQQVTVNGKRNVESLLAALGETVGVDDDQMDLCTGLAGAAPRYVFAVIEALAEAGTASGMNEADAIKIAAQVAAGSGLAVLQSGLDIEALKALTPLQPLDEAAAKPLFRQAVETARAKMGDVWAGMMKGRD